MGCRRYVSSFKRPPSAPRPACSYRMRLIRHTARRPYAAEIVGRATPEQDAAYRHRQELWPEHGSLAPAQAELVVDEGLELDEALRWPTVADEDEETEDSAGQSKICTM